MFLLAWLVCLSRLATPLRWVEAVTKKGNYCMLCYPFKIFLDCPDLLIGLN